jgi:hypothetical protein
MGLAENTRDAVSCVMEAARGTVQRVDLYLVRGPESALRKWNLPSNTFDEDLTDTTIPLSELSSLMDQIKRKRLFFGDRSSFADQHVVKELSSSFARKVLFLPIIVKGRVLGLLCADNGQRNMTLNHVGDLMTFSTLISLALMLNKPSSIVPLRNRTDSS